MGTVHDLEQPTGLLAAVRAAIGAMPWLTAADGAMVALALDYAARIDDAADDKTAGYLGQNLSGTLRALGGSPAERRTLGIGEPAAGKLAAMRAARRTS